MPRSNCQLGTEGCILNQELPPSTYTSCQYFHQCGTDIVYDVKAFSPKSTSTQELWFVLVHLRILGQGSHRFVRLPTCVSIAKFVAHGVSVQICYLVEISSLPVIAHDASRIWSNAVKLPHQASDSMARGVYEGGAW
jgi:hypothetical protein